MNSWLKLLLTRWLWISCLLMISITLSAQKNKDAELDFFHRKSVEVNSKKKKSKKQPKVSKLDTMHMAVDTSRNLNSIWALAFSGGTQGVIGGDLALALGPKINARLGYHSMAFSINQAEISIAEETLLFNANFNNNNLSLLGEYELLGEKLRLVAGLAYKLGDLLSGDGILADSVSVQDISVSPEEVGYVRGTISSKSKLLPYFGIGIGRAVPKKRLGLSMDLGAIYQNSPEVNLDASNLLRNNENNEAVIQDAIAFFKWWPVMNFRIAFKIK